MSELMRENMQDITTDDILDNIIFEADRIQSEGHNSLAAIEAAQDFVKQYGGHFEGEDAEYLENVISSYDYTLTEKRAELDQQTIDDVLAKASGIWEGCSDSNKLYWIRDAKEFLQSCEGYFTGEAEARLNDEISHLTELIEMAMAKVETRTIDEVMEESYRIEKEGEFSSDAMTEAKTFLHQYSGYFTGKDAERLGQAHSEIFRELHEAIERESEPRKPRSEEEIREYEEVERENEELLKASGIITIY